MNSKKILLLVLLVALVLPVLASADIAGIVSTTVMNVLYIGWGIVTIGWVLTGYLFLTAGGDAGKTNLAKTALITMVAGTIVMFIIYTYGSNGAGLFIKNSFGL